MKKILVLVGTVGMLAVPVAVAQDLDVEKLTANNAIVQTVKSGFVKANDETTITVESKTNIQPSLEKKGTVTVENKEVKIKDEKTNKVVEVKANDLIGMVTSAAKLETEEEKVELKTKLDAVVTQNAVKDEDTKEVVVELGPNDLFGLVGGPESEYNTPEFQAKWDAMMAQRTVNQVSVEENTIVEEK